MTADDWIDRPCCICGTLTPGLDPEKWHSDPPPLCSQKCREERKRRIKEWASSQGFGANDGR